MEEKRERKKLAILRALAETDQPLTSQQATELLLTAGFEISDRSLRVYFEQLQSEGLIDRDGRRGCSIIAKGRAYLKMHQISHGKIGYLSAKIDQMAYRMTFDCARKSGSVVVNLSLVTKELLGRYAQSVAKVFKCGFAMGNHLALLEEGEVFDSYTIPEGKIGMCTVCSITLNGVLLKHGIPVSSRFGGLLEMRNYKPTHFSEIIHYDGTSIDPLEIFIRSGMTDYCGAIKNGNGRVGASFREIPTESRDVVSNLAEQLSHCGLGGFMKIGLPGQPVQGVVVNEGRCGALVIGGLNPVAIFEENGHRIQSRALAGLLDFSRLQSYEILYSY